MILRFGIVLSKIICNDCLNRFNVPVSLSSEIESEHDVVAVFMIDALICASFRLIPSCILVLNY